MYLKSFCAEKSAVRNWKQWCSERKGLWEIQCTSICNVKTKRKKTSVLFSHIWKRMTRVSTADWIILFIIIYYLQDIEWSVTFSTCTAFAYSTKKQLQCKGKRPENWNSSMYLSTLYVFSFLSPTNFTVAFYPSWYWLIFTIVIPLTPSRNEWAKTTRQWHALSKAGVRLLALQCVWLHTVT